MASLGLTVARVERQVIVTAPGIQGPPGIQGQTGGTGATGPIGPQGNSISIKGTLAAGAWSAPESPTVGDIWIAGGSITGDVTAILGDGIEWTGTLWVNVGQVRGPIGPQGNAAILRGTLPAGTWVAPGSAVAGDIWLAGGAITGGVTATAGDGISFNGSTWVNFGPFRGPVGPSGSVNGTVGNVPVFVSGTAVGNGSLTDNGATISAPSGKNLDASQGSLASLARANNQGAICFSGATIDRGTIDLTSQVIGTGDLSVMLTVRLPDSLPSAVSYVIGISEAVSTDVIFVNLNTNILQGQAKKTGETTLTGNILSTSAFTALLGQVVCIGIRRVGNVVSFSINGTVLLTLTGNAAALSFSSAARIYLGSLGPGTVSYTSRIYSAAIYNRALSDAELLEFAKTGIAPADEWGTQTPVWSSDFSAGVDGLSATYATAAGNVDAILGVDNCFALTVNGTTGAHCATKSILNSSKRHRISLSYYIPAGNSVVKKISVFVGNSSTPIQLTTTGAWTTTVIEAVATPSSILGFWAATSSGSSTVAGNSTDVFYLKDVVITPIGVISTPNVAQGAGSTLYDRSTNYLDAVLTGAYTHALPSVFGEINTRVGAYIWKSISALGATYQRLFAGIVSGVFTIQSQAAGLSLVDLAINVGSGTGILIKAATGFTFANTWRVNKGTVSIAAGATYTPADTINDAHEITINSGSGTTPIALSNLTAVSGDSRVVRFSVINTTGSAVTVTTTGAVTNSSTSVAAGAKILIVVSIIGGNAYVNVIV